MRLGITGVLDGHDDLLRRARIQAFEDGDIVACEPKEARSSNQAIRMAEIGNDGRPLRRHRLLPHRRPGAGDFADAVILKTVGEVDSGLLAG